VQIEESGSHTMAKELLIAFGVMGICLVIHVTGIMVVAEVLVRQRQKIEDRIGFTYAGCLLSIVFTAVIILHVSEAGIWAAFYSWNGLFHDFETSLYFSLSSYTTAGYGEVLLPRSWRLLGTIEAISGVLLCGLSAAFLFAIVNALFRFGRTDSRGEQSHKDES
jgi:Ion channel